VRNAAREHDEGTGRDVHDFVADVAGDGAAYHVKAFLLAGVHVQPRGNTGIAPAGHIGE
jgi:hypothetical protein